MVSPFGNLPVHPLLGEDQRAFVAAAHRDGHFDFFAVEGVQPLRRVRGCRLASRLALTYHENRSELSMFAREACQADPIARQSGKNSSSFAAGKAHHAPDPSDSKMILTHDVET